MKRKAEEISAEENSAELSGKPAKNKLKKKKEKQGKFEKPLGKKSDKVDKKNVSNKPNVGKMKEEYKKCVKNGASDEKPNWFEFKKKKKELKEKRKAQKFTDVYDKCVKAKQLCEKLRRSDCSPQNREKLATQLHKLLEHHYNKVVFTHDMSRIIQWVLRYCTSDVRQAIVEEVKPSIVSMIQSKYAKNCVRNMMKYGSPEVRSYVITACYGNIVKLMSHSVSAPLIELIYSTWATETDKLYFKQEFYGDMYKYAKDSKIKSLSDVFKTAPDMKSATLTAIKGNLTRILNKELVNSTLVQLILWEFLQNCSAADRSEIIVMLRESIVELSHTKIGSKVGVICIWHGTNKDRKFIMKSMKENVKSICMSEHGYWLLLALFDSVDDTVLARKIILSEILNDLTEIALNEHGKHVILYLVARRDSHYFPPSKVEYLKKGDGNENSKKFPEIREKELRDAVSDSFLETIAADAATWLSNASISMVTLAILKAASGEKLKLAFEAVASFITNVDSKIKENDVECNAIEHSGLHVMLKKLIQNDKNLHEMNETCFGTILINQLTKDILKYWIQFNRGCFLLILLLENEAESDVDILQSKLKLVTKSLKSKSSPGASILKKKLSIN